jgi:hypothetical protein
VGSIGSQYFLLCLKDPPLNTIFAGRSSKEHKKPVLPVSPISLAIRIYLYQIYHWLPRLTMGNPTLESKRIDEDVFAVPTTPSSLDEKERAGSPSSLDQQPVDDIDPKEESAFVWRLDLWFLTIGFLGYMFKYIDQTNINNAYVSGMKEDLNLHGNELNYFTTYFNVSPALGPCCTGR